MISSESLALLSGLLGFTALFISDPPSTFEPDVDILDESQLFLDARWKIVKETFRLSIIQSQMNGCSPMM